MIVPLQSLSRDPLAVLLPGCHDPAERETRRRLMIARDIASANVTRLGPGHALTLNWLIVEAAAASVFVPATREELDEVVRYCRRLLLCARFAECRRMPDED
jgi:hypothetical protein